MRWSIKLGSVSGIGVYMHLTFLLLLAWVGLVHLTREASLPAAVQGVAFVLAIFGCVVLHELGHALTARRFGIRTRDITLLPIGGLARLERMPDDPRQEFLVAIAGPAVNVAIAAVLVVLMLLAGLATAPQQLGLTGGPFLQRLAVVNVFLVLFNLIPAFPMDGGRVLRALLATRIEYARATQIAAATGQGIALLFGFIGLFANPFLLFIAFFVWIGAAQEASMVEVRSSLGGIPVGQAMIRDFHELSPLDPLSRAVALTLETSQKDYPVVEDGTTVGVLTQGDLLAALSERGPDSRVAQAMRREFHVVDPQDTLDSAFGRLQERDCRTLPVAREGKLVGLLTLDNVGEFLAIRSALDRRGRPRFAR